MKWLKTLAMAFSMYSKLPMPQFPWTKETMRYLFCFFPLIGVVIGALELLWMRLALFIGTGDLLRSCVLVLIPVLVTGGIHLDGFLDTSDALASWQPPEKRLEILKDPHTGAFAVIAGCAYFTASLGIWSEADFTAAQILAAGFVLSRALSGFGVCTFPCAKGSGLAATFADAADQRRCRICLIAWAAAAVAAMLAADPFGGAAAAAAAVLTCLLSRRMALKKFGGITGDIQGFFLQMCELIMAFAAVIGGNISETI